MKSCTDLEQSRKLAEFLPLESADMALCSKIQPLMTDYISAKKKFSNAGEIPIDPCWSLAALFSMLPKSAYLEKGSSTELCRVTLPVELISSDWNIEPIDACVEVILKLRKQKLL